LQPSAAEVGAFGALCACGLPHLFGANGYAVVRNVQMLPQVLPRLYVQLTGNP
jgi:hypothetical protein